MQNTKLKICITKYQTEAFAIGDGTAGRETEQFIKGLNRVCHYIW